MFRQTGLSLACFALMPLAHAADHQIDPTFGINSQGWSRLYEPASGTQDEKAVAFARTADGGYVVALELPGGLANSSTGKRIGLARLDRDGHYVVSGFGSNGRVFKDAMLTSVTDMTIDSQGRIIVVGATPGQANLSDFGVVRFNANGSDDTSFSGDGRTSFGFDNVENSFKDVPTSVLADPDGRIVVAGNSQYGNSPREVGIVRFNVNGSIDSTFGSYDDGAGGTRGSTDSFKPGEDASAGRVLRMVDGHYVIAGTSKASATDANFAARIFDPLGRTFGGSVGSETFPIDEPGPGGSSFERVMDAIAVDPTTILLVGSASNKCAATRIKVSKELPSSQYYYVLDWDPSFIGSAIPGRPNRYVGGPFDSSCTSAALAADGRMVLVGGTSSTSVTGWTLDSPSEPSGDGPSYVGLVTRLNPNGSPDISFGDGGSFIYIAPTSGALPSSYTGFRSVRFDGTQPVIIGSSVDSASSAVDFDGVMTRLKTADLIFANGFE